MASMLSVSGSLKVAVIEESLALEEVENEEELKLIWFSELFFELEFWFPPNLLAEEALEAAPEPF